MRAVDINTEARAKSQAAFPVGSTVKPKHGGAPAPVIGHTSGGVVVVEQYGAVTAYKPEHLDLLP